MHPDILREIAAQRGRDRQAQAREASLSRRLRAARRGAAARSEADELLIPAIPDYVDGSFRTEPADDTAAGQPGQVTTTHCA